MEDVKITNHQIFSLTACSAFGGVVLFVPAAVAGVAQQDAWLSAAIAPIWGLLILKLYSSFGKLYPNMTFIEIIMQILGKRIGWLAAAGFILYCSFLSTNIIWNISSYVTSQAMPETPSYVISVIFVIAIVIGLLYGLETIARASELVLLFASFLFILTMIFSLPNVKIENILPIFEKGIASSIKGSVILTDFMPLTLITILIIYPKNVDNIWTSEKSIYKGYLWSAFLIFICILMNILVLGTTITTNSLYPTHLLAMEINIELGNFGFESLIALMWFSTFFIVSTLFFYAAVKGLSQLFGLADHKKIILPIGLIFLIMTQINFPNQVYELNWIQLVLLPFDVTFSLILPIVLLLVSQIKKHIIKR